MSFVQLQKRLLGAVLAVGALLGSNAARAEGNLELSYTVPIIGIEMLYRGMGYADEEGNFIDIAGAHIISSTVKLDFYTDPSTDVSTLFMGMNVPVLDAQSYYFTVTGDQLQQLEPGHYSYSLTTDIFNGEVYSGRFSVSSYALDAEGNPVQLPGFVGEGSGFYFTYDIAAPVPEPASALLLLAGLGVAPVLARRRKAAQAV